MKLISIFRILCLLFLPFIAFGQNCSRYSEEELHNTVEKLNSEGFEFRNYLVLKPSGSIERNYTVVFSREEIYRFEVINFSGKPFGITILEKDSILKDYMLNKNEVQNQIIEFTCQKTEIYTIRLTHGKSGCVFTAVGCKRKEQD
jgi:hypothetical protein